MNIHAIEMPKTSIHELSRCLGPFNMRTLIMSLWREVAIRPKCWDWLSSEFWAGRRTGNCTGDVSTRVVWRYGPSWLSRGYVNFPFQRSEIQHHTYLGEARFQGWLTSYLQVGLSRATLQEKCQKVRFRYLQTILKPSTLSLQGWSQWELPFVYP